MDKLQWISPSTSASNMSSLTPKRTLIPHRPMTPLQTIKEETEKLKENVRTPLRRNPFDVKAEALYFPACSPSVFAHFQRNKVNDGTFKWSIEHLSVLYPADIDETSVPDTWVDAEHEVKAQKAIDTFFSQNSIVPSPWSSSPKEGDVKSRRRACINSVFQDVQSSEATTQTMLSIPPNVDLSQILGMFFTYDDKEDNSSRENSREEADLLSNSSLRRKLFVNDDECVSPCRVEHKNFHSAKRWSTPTVHMRTLQTTPASDVLSSSPITPPTCSDSCNVLSSPPVSPIAATAPLKGMQMESFSDSQREESISNSPSKPYSHSVVAAADSAMSFCVESQDTIPFPSYGSERLDTGYATGSISSSQNMTASEVHYGLVSRITPVAELMEECELSNSVSCDMSYRNDCGLVGEVSSSDCTKSALSNLCNFKTYPWVPTCCSTPTQCSHL